MNKKELIDEARELGCKSVTIEGITYEIGPVPKSFEPMSDQAAEELISPLAFLDQISDEDVLYWSSPFYDQLQYEKDERKRMLEENNDQNM